MTMNQDHLINTGWVTEELVIIEMLVEVVEIGKIIHHQYPGKIIPLNL